MSYVNDNITINNGYARVSKDEQALGLQVNALLKEGCSKKHIYTEHVSGSWFSKLGCDKCIEILRPGYILVVWRLDRLGKSMAHLINLIEFLMEKGIGFKSI